MNVWIGLIWLRNGTFVVVYDWDCLVARLKKRSALSSPHPPTVPRCTRVHARASTPPLSLSVCIIGKSCTVSDIKIRNCVSVLVSFSLPHSCHSCGHHETRGVRGGTTPEILNVDARWRSANFPPQALLSFYLLNIRMYGPQTRSVRSEEPRLISPALNRTTISRSYSS